MYCPVNLVLLQFGSPVRGCCKRTGRSGLAVSKRRDFNFAGEPDPVENTMDNSTSFDSLGTFSFASGFVCPSENQSDLIV